MREREREKEKFTQISTFCNKDNTDIYVSEQSPWYVTTIYLGIDENINDRERETHTHLGQIDSWRYLVAMLYMWTANSKCVSSSIHVNLGYSILIILYLLVLHWQYIIVGSLVLSQLLLFFYSLYDSVFMKKTPVSLPSILSISL